MSKGTLEGNRKYTYACRKCMMMVQKDFQTSTRMKLKTLCLDDVGRGNIIIIIIIIACQYA